MQDLHGRFIKVAYAADQRRTGHGPIFPGAAGYSNSSKGNDGYETVDRDNFYGERHGAYIDRNYSSPNVGNNQGFVADYSAQNFGGNPSGHYGASVGGSYGATGSFNASGHSNENADRYGTNYGEANSLNDRTPYDSVSHGSDYGQHHNLESGDRY